MCAPQARAVQAVFESGTLQHTELDLHPEPEGTFTLDTDALRPGDLYRYRMDAGDPWPDPASRFQPHGVHGPSQLIDTSAFHWSDSQWQGIAPEDLVLYELHVGAFTSEGTFAAAAKKLPHLCDLGVTCVELMPIADFPGARNWGYDGVSLFAPAHTYGTPQELAVFVDAAHQLGLAVHLDVVYNHLGPDGAYLAAFSPFVFSERHKSPWGAGLNFDGPHSEVLRRFLIENALHWIHAFHFDGLRLDATHAIVDDSPMHFLAQLRQAVDDSLPAGSRRVLLIAEDDRNLARIAAPRDKGGYGLDGLWADDLHHQVHRCLTGQADGYFADFSGTAADIATTVEKGWFYCGQHAGYFGRNRGSDPTGLPPSAFVVCLQNHDQAGNRAMGERLNHLVELAAYRAATVLLLLAPETPLLFMGQEWAATTPFQYFTDHNEELGRKVTEGRRREFARFAGFSTSAARERIPDPRDLATFTRSKLKWEEMDTGPHAGTLRLYRALLQLRARHPAMRDSSRAGFMIAPLGKDGLMLERTCGPHRLRAIVQLAGQLAGLAGHELQTSSLSPFPQGSTWNTILTTEDPGFTIDPMPVEFSHERLNVRFRRPGAIVLEACIATQQGGEQI
ncbi:MAG: malto-oligosyltrehalose trehalohydrolase [Terracidiphilus sp.]